MTVNEMFKDSKRSSIKTHLSSGSGGIDGFFSAEYLRSHYGDCDCEVISYEKDYGIDENGNHMIATRSFLKVYDKERRNPDGGK